MSALVSGNWIRNNWLDDMFREVDPAYYVKPLHGQSLPRLGQIRMDVKETDAAYTVEAEMPGVKKQDIQVSIDGSTITLSAEIRQEDTETKDKKVLRSERYYGAVSRSVQLAHEIDQSLAKAHYDQGVLTLILPKKQMSASKHLKID